MEFSNYGNENDRRETRILYVKLDKIKLFQITVFNSPVLNLKVNKDTPKSIDCMLNSSVHFLRLITPRTAKIRYDHYYTSTVEMGLL